jgi:hypothetical protein
MEGFIPHIPLPRLALSVLRVTKSGGVVILALVLRSSVVPSQGESRQILSTWLRFSMFQYPVGVNKLEKARMGGKGQFLQDSMDYLFEPGKMDGELVEKCRSR